MNIQLYGSDTIDSLEWPQTDDGLYAKKHLRAFVKNGISPYIRNIDASSFAIKADDIVLPIVVADGRSKSSWVCSTMAQFVDYGQEYTTLIDNPLLAGLVKRGLKGIGYCGAASKLDSAVYVNNWLFAVDLYPKGISEEHVRGIRDFLVARYPEHAIIFRSLNPVVTQPLIGFLKRAGFGMLASRYVHITDTSDDSIFRTRVIKSDFKLLRESSFQIFDEGQIDVSEYPDLLALYNSLYITHHSARNPQLTELYMKMLAENGLLKFKILKQDGRIRGVAGYLKRNGVFLCPLFGYEKDDPDHNTIYRLLNTLLLLEAQKEKLIFHQSAGASFYKSIRRAKGSYEYNAIYTRHLPFKQRAGWATLKTLINTVAPPFMRKY